MGDGTTAVSRILSDGPATKYVFVGLLVLLLVIAVGHLPAITGLTDRYLGLPLWVWVQLVVVTIMLGIAWIAVQLVPSSGRER